MAFIFVHYPQQPSLHARPLLSCGNSMSEARDNGCTWDDLSKQWLPAACPRIGNEEFLQRQDQWSFYFEQEARTVIPNISVLVDENRADWYTTEGEHLTHCAFILLRMAHALFSGDRIDRVTSKYHHAVHCTSYLLNATKWSPNWNVITSRGNSLFGWC
ncbi:hypothetical protein AOQ84DRAFT_291709 [Glonium stellatum]|uniref:Uncharacterized protein n=1 Tax=Glonium stellatum TaxID=574774 RepID=A0A8E2F244_9PEZI|nr:hypothetical protein AOQ84DRAFT_291709 [Glonium stellatum]